MVMACTLRCASAAAFPRVSLRGTPNIRGSKQRIAQRRAAAPRVIAASTATDLDSDDVVVHADFLVRRDPAPSVGTSAAFSTPTRCNLIVIVSSV